MSSLKKKLFDEYGGFADKRIKKLEKGSTFIVDDRTEDDIGANRQLYSYFCMVFAKIGPEAGMTADESVTVTLNGSVPMSAGVQAWISANEASYRTGPLGGILTFPVAKGEETRLRSLAKSIRAITAAGARYDVKSYKYVCPRTANTLERLASVLEGAW